MKRETKTIGVMIDMSRNAVMSIVGLKRFLSLLQKMGYNCVMLYTEDTYEVDSEPYFGYMRGRYSKAEMKEIDAFASALGMRVIPCIQTLAHLDTAFRWGNIPKDCGNILLVDDDRTYELIGHMFATLSECFSSKTIHIGMDEAAMLGRGKHLDLHGYEEASSIMKRHLQRVCGIAEKYGYTELLMWSDMFFRTWNGGRYVVPRCEIPKTVVRSVPASVVPVFWDYYNTKEEIYSDMMENHRQLSDRMWFAGGVWSWFGVTPFNRYSLDTMIPALNACEENGVKNIIFTMWGDMGGECSHFSQLPALYYLAQYAQGVRDESRIKAGFKRLIGIDFDEYMIIDCPNQVIPYGGKPCNPAKYMLYSDYFNGYVDASIKPGGGKRYAEFARQLDVTAKKSRRYGYVFDTLAKLCDVLEIKYELGLRTRKAYQEKDRKALKQLAETEYPEVEKRLRIFGRALEKQWMRDNKPHGFDVQDHCLGAILMRTQACRRRLLSYTNGKIDRIEELEETLMFYKADEESLLLNSMNNIMSCNRK